MRRETKLWLDRADYDLETAEAMFKSAHNVLKTLGRLSNA